VGIVRKWERFATSTNSSQLKVTSDDARSDAYGKEMMQYLLESPLSVGEIQSAKQDSRISMFIALCPALSQ